MYYLLQNKVHKIESKHYRDFPLSNNNNTPWNSSNNTHKQHNNKYVSQAGD